jgi:hypothetical protein
MTAADLTRLRLLLASWRAEASPHMSDPTDSTLERCADELSAALDEITREPAELSASEATLAPTHARDCIIIPFGLCNCGLTTEGERA